MYSSASVQGTELIAGRAFLDACEAKWLVTLGEFDTANAYEIDGHASCVAWLVDMCRMGRSTAKEKLRTAHEMRRRPVIADAFVNGTLSYSQARAFTRLSGLHDDRDEALITEFANESTDTIERMVRWWNLRNSGEPGPPDPFDVPRVRFQPGFGGANGRIIIDGPNEDLARFMNVTDAYGSFLYFSSKPVNEASAEPRVVLRADDNDQPASTIEDASGEPPPDVATWFKTEAVDEASAEPPRSLAQRRFEWLFDLIEEIALVRDHQLDSSRAAVGVTVPYESLIGEVNASKIGILDTGSILTGDAVRRLCCDADISRLVTKGVSEILDVGRETRTWNRAQRRAIRHRHGNRCAIRGCDRRITEIHHLTYWRNGGKTCIENGVPLCSRHHHMVHDLGWLLDWDIDTGTVTFTGPYGQMLKTEADPILRRTPAFAA